MMNDQIEELLKMKIIWQEYDGTVTRFWSNVEDSVAELQMNDFPDNPLYTVKWKGLDKSFDDLPSLWKIPKL